MEIKIKRISKKKNEKLKLRSNMKLYELEICCCWKNQPTISEVKFKIQKSVSLDGEDKENKSC